MIWFFISALILAAGLFIADILLAAPKYNANTSNHFNGKKFINPNNAGTHSYWEVLVWWLGGNDKGEWPKINKTDVSDFSAPVKEVASSELHVTFVNHATFLLQVDGMNILTDPIWSYRASPYQWIGPKRMRPPGMAFENLPDIDAVLISHNHYDHLDLATVQKLQEQHNPQFVVPLGVERFLHDNGITNTVHLDWWDQHEVLQELPLTAVPAQHFSGRGLFDRNKTLWCGYVLHTSVGNIYFAGDTGYGTFFKEIGNRFGPMHTSLIPIGAYKPRWFMKPIHLSPQEAIQAHKDVNSQSSFATHFGTFPMADDGMYEAAETLKNKLSSDKQLQEQFHMLDEGDTKIFKDKDASIAM